MLALTENNILNYYHNYCELAIWFKKIILHSDPAQGIKRQDITEEFITERNRILLYIPAESRNAVKKKLNNIALGYYCKISSWSKNQKVALDMV